MSPWVTRQGTTYKPPPELPEVPTIKYRRQHPNQMALDFESQTTTDQHSHLEPPPRKGQPK